MYNRYIFSYSCCLLLFPAYAHAHACSGGARNTNKKNQKIYWNFNTYYLNLWWKAIFEFPLPVHEFSRMSKEFTSLYIIKKNKKFALFAQWKFLAIEDSIEPSCHHLVPTLHACVYVYYF